MSLTRTHALHLMKTQLENAANVSFDEEGSDYFRVTCNRSNCGAGVSVRPNGSSTQIKVIVAYADVVSLLDLHTRTFGSRTTTLGLQLGSWNVSVQKTSNPTGNRMVRFNQPLSEEGVFNCVRFIVAVFNNSATRWSAAV